MSDNLAAATIKYSCTYCHREFARESSLVVHMCEPKRRRQEQHERPVQLAFHAWLKFYEIAQGSSKLRTFDDFADSPYYRAFVKFGRYCVDVRVIAPERFLEWLLRSNKKLDRWASDTVYTEYLIQYLPQESVDEAVARALEYALTWAERNHSVAEHCLRYGNHGILCHAITAGRISPWVIYNCESGQSMLDSLNADHVAMIWPYIDSDVWNRRFRDYAADTAYVKMLLEQAGW